MPEGIHFSLYQKERFVSQFGNKTHKKRNSFEFWAKVISSARKHYKGNYHLRFDSLFLDFRIKMTGVYKIFHSSDDLRTANIICDAKDGVTCLVIDRETFKQLISNLDEIRNKYSDEGTLERKRWEILIISIRSAHNSKTHYNRIIFYK